MYHSHSYHHFHTISKLLRFKKERLPVSIILSDVVKIFDKLRSDFVTSSVYLHKLKFYMVW